MSGAEMVARVDADEALQKQTAALIRDERQLDDELDRFFRKYEELVERHLDARTAFQRRFNPPMAAAYGAWRQHGDRDHRLELAQLAEAPLGPEENGR